MHVTSVLSSEASLPRPQYTERRAAIAIGAAPIKGSRISITADRIEYDLLEGTFAGGRFVIWEVGGSLQAELLIFGSGVPIVSGNRGSLCPSR